MAASPLYRKVYDRLKDRIISGTYPRAATLPSETKIASEFAVSSITVRRALHELALDGYIDRRQGIGNVVLGRERSIVVGLSTFTSDVASGRLRIVRSLLADEMITANSDIAERLGVSPESTLRYLSRLDAHGAEPFSVDEVYTTVAHGSAITREMASSPVFVRLWEDKTGILIRRTDYELRAELPDTRLQNLLQADPHTPVLYVGEKMCDGVGRPLFWIVTRYHGPRSLVASSVELHRGE